MPRVHVLPKGEHIAPMPEPIKGEIGRKLPGGYCPRGMRTQWTNMAGAHKSTRRYVAYESSPQEYVRRYGTTSTGMRLEREMRLGLRVTESAL